MIHFGERFYEYCAADQGQEKNQGNEDTVKGKGREILHDVSTWHQCGSSYIRYSENESLRYL